MPGCIVDKNTLWRVSAIKKCFVIFNSKIIIMSTPLKLSLLPAAVFFCFGLLPSRLNPKQQSRCKAAVKPVAKPAGCKKPDYEKNES